MHQMSDPSAIADAVLGAVPSTEHQREFLEDPDVAAAGEADRWTRDHPRRGES